ncbi:MAG TPA: hypothetical protein EYG94_08000 [Campylobacterales bacterium]|nr:hypothetical protein [Campylobacterales bacterium]
MSNCPRKHKKVKTKSDIFFK